MDPQVAVVSGKGAAALGVDAYYPAQNLMGGAKYFAERLRAFHGDVAGGCSKDHEGILEKGL
jgi:soluble lytic murein transglycosylase-like protein